MLKTFLQENQIIIPSYQHYGGMSGFQDYGINGCRIKAKIISVWKDLFIKDNIFEVEIPSIMPHAILKASGHVDRFTDAVVTDSAGIQHRADHLAKKWFNDNAMGNLADQVDSWDPQTLEENINQYLMLDGRSDYHVTKKNLMVEAGISNSTFELQSNPDFLRPELAQGIFVNFKHYHSYIQPDTNANFKPFGIAQIGKSYRKEISPQPFVRLREFTQAEIEYFVDPMEKSKPDFNDYNDYANLVIPILTSDMQEQGMDMLHISVRDAVSQGHISHALMGYFLAKIYHFAHKIGLHADKIRFRQHLDNEMAHYASQCWDLECLVAGSWLECVGCADRGSYDLESHSKINQAQPLTAKRNLQHPIKKLHYTIIPNVSALKNSYPKNIASIKSYFKDLDLDSNQTVAENISRHLDQYSSIELEINKSNYIFDKCMLNIKMKEITINNESFTPHVIEPSFGIDRLIYATLEHNIWVRKSDERRLVLSLPSALQLYDAAVFPLHKKDSMINMANTIRADLVASGLRCYCDDSSTAIGKKYVRCDEIGVAKVFTIDPGSVQNGFITIRDRDSMEQITLPIDDIRSYLKKID